MRKLTDMELDEIDAEITNMLVAVIKNVAATHGLNTMHNKAEMIAIEIRPLRVLVDELIMKLRQYWIEKQNNGIKN